MQSFAHPRIIYDNDMDKRHLVELCQAGDRESLGILYETSYSPMMKIIQRYVPDKSTAQDIFHDGFIIVITSLNQLKDPDKLDAWMAIIMKNLALEYHRKMASSIIVQMPEIDVPEDSNDRLSDKFSLEWPELEKIINRLPEGYKNVFHLSILDGLSHNEIGDLLGIEPHSSSSQLFHAKKLLRKLISEYWKGLTIILIAVTTSIIAWHNFKRTETADEPSIIADKDDSVIKPALPSDSVLDDNPAQEKEKGLIHYITRKNTSIQSPEYISETTEQTEISADVKPNETDTANINLTPPALKLLPENKTLKHYKKSLQSNSMDWSLSLAYSGLQSNDNSRVYYIPDPDTDISSSDTKIEVSENTRHHIPITIELSLNKDLSPRWSIETGVRYTFLQSDITTESSLSLTENIQKIHYIGIPIKINYNLFRSARFSIYGQGGVALDIPIHGASSKTTLDYELSPSFETHTQTINAPLQWSVGAGLGVQYNITPAISIYAEPSLRYYINTESNIITIRQDKPFEFTLPIGLRFNW